MARAEMATDAGERLDRLVMRCRRDVTPEATFRHLERPPTWQRQAVTVGIRIFARPARRIDRHHPFETLGDGRNDERMWLVRVVHHDQHITS